MKRIGFIGFGNMGSALALGIVRSGLVSSSNIFAYDKDISKLDKAKLEGLNVCNDSLDILNNADYIILAVKPKDLVDSLKPFKNFKDIKLLKEKVIVSILAGTSVKMISDALGFDIPIVRVMPNTPALIGEGAFGIFFNSLVSEEDKSFIKKIFDSLGKSIVVDKEDIMDVITGLSGSGPAYIFVVIQALADGGVRMGLDRESALVLASQTVLGSAKMVLENIGKFHPEQLKDMVMSPAGTTAEGLVSLEENKVRYAFIKAVELATKRSRDLSKL
ncbi:MAG: pyrroline-5-carboxylate reductase [Brevinematia bacterium]